MASTWRKARAWQAGQLRDPYLHPSLPGPEVLHVPEDPSPSSSHSPACDNCGPIPTAQYLGISGVPTFLLVPPSGYFNAQPEDRDPSTEFFEAPLLGDGVLHHLLPLISPGEPLSSGGPFFRGLGCPWDKPLLRSMSPYTPLPSGPISPCAPTFTAPKH